MPSAEVEQRQDLGGLITDKSVLKSQISLQNQLDEIVNKKDKDIAVEIAKRVKSERPDIGRDELKSILDRALPVAKKKYAEKKSRLENQLKQLQGPTRDEALAGKQPETAEAPAANWWEEYVSRPFDKYVGGPIHGITSTLMAPSKAVEGATVGGLKELREQTKNEPLQFNDDPTRTTLEIPNLNTWEIIKKAALGPAEIAYSLLTQSPAEAKETLSGDFLPSVTEPEAEPTKFSVGLSDLTLLDEARDWYTPGRDLNIRGVPVKTAMESLLTGDDSFTRLAKAMGEGAVEGAKSAYTGDRSHDLAEYQREVNMDNAERAWLKATAELGVEAPVEAIQKRADQIALNLSESFSEQNPEAGQTMFNMVADPLNVVPVGKMVAAIPGVKKLGQAAREAVSPFPTDKLMRLGDKGEEAASLARLSFDEGAGTANQLQSPLAENIKKLEKVPEADRRAAMEALEAGIPKSALPERLQQTVATLEEMAEGTFNNILEPYGLGARWSDEGERIIAQRKGYVPHVVRESGDIERQFETLGIGPQGRETIEIGSAQQRKTKTGHVKDPLVQWKQVYSDLSEQLPRAIELKKLDEYLQEPGFVKHFDTPTLENLSDAERFDIVNELIKEQEAALPGSKFMNVADEVQDIMDRIGGPSNMFKGSRITLVEQNVGERIKELTPFFAKNPGEIDKALKAAQRSLAVVAPAMKTWRLATTMTVPGSRIRDAMSAFGLNTLANGIQALRPKLNRNAAELALVAASNGSKEALKTGLKLKSGKQITLGQALDIMQRTGMVNQSDLRIGTNIGKGSEKFKLDVLMRKGADKAAQLAEHLPTGKMAQLTDNYQKAVVFLNALEDTTPAAIAKAVDFTSKFAGNYRRLHPFEKTILRDTFGFYAWTRFIFPHVMKQVVENPQRMAAWLKVKDHYKRTWASDQTKGTDETKNPFLRDFAIPSPFQPDDKDKAAYLLMETPDSMGLSLLNIFEGDEAATDLAGPLAKFVIDMASTYDPKTGRFKGDFIDRLVGMDASDPGALGKLLGSFDRPSKAYQNLIDLYLRNGDVNTALRLEMQYKALRDLTGLGVYLNDPSREFTRTQEKKLEAAGRRK